MNREQLSKYKKNKRDIENLDGIIAKLQERLDAVPVVSGKVTKSSDEFPYICLLYTSPSPRDGLLSRMPSSA